MTIDTNRGPTGKVHVDPAADFTLCYPRPIRATGVFCVLICHCEPALCILATGKERERERDPENVAALTLRLPTSSPLRPATVLLQN